MGLATTYGTVFGGFCILTALVFLLGIVFTGRLIVLRYVIWSISFLLLLLTISISIKHSKMISEHEHSLAGTFYLDVTNSLYDSIILEKYNDLKLDVYVNNSFDLSRASPFFPSSKGHWSYFDDGDIAFIEGGFYNSSERLIINPDSTKWVFTSINSTKLLEGQKIIFIRSK